MNWVGAIRMALFEAGYLSSFETGCGGVKGKE
jgi:hypothetical protein